jgi:hypothetical protein
MASVKFVDKSFECTAPSASVEIRQSITEVDPAAWDRQIEADSANGKLDKLASEAFVDYRSATGVLAQNIPTHDSNAQRLPELRLIDAGPLKNSWIVAAIADGRK